MILTVGQTKQFASPQLAVDYLVSSLITNGSKTLQTETIIEIDTGIYGGLVIPDNSILPTSTARLIIRGKAGHKVVLSGDVQSTLLGNGSNLVGIGIGTGIPYVTIRDLYVEKFHKGIVLSAGCHSCRIYANYIRLSANVGIWAYRSDKVQISNCIVLDSGNGIAITEANEMAIIGNDIINYSTPTAISTSGIRYALHLTTVTPNSLTPGGTFVIYNNNISAIDGVLIGYGNWVLPKLRSNHNNLHSINGKYGRHVGSIAGIADANTLGEWQAISVNDPMSISTEVDYYIKRKVGNSIFTEIQLQNYINFGGISSGLRGLCAMTASGSGSSVNLGGLPYYVDTEELCNTIQTNKTSGTPSGTTSISRPYTVAIGALDSNLDTAGFFSTSVAPAGSVEEDSCGGSYSFINTIEEKYSNSIDCVHPSVKAGFFYINDAQYYLYCKKEAHYIKDIMVTDIILASILVNKPSAGTDKIKVYIDNTELDESSFAVRGNVLRVNHANLDLDDMNSIVEVIGTVMNWDGSRFVYETFRQETRLRDGITKYLLPSVPTRGAPVIITDDTISMTANPAFCGREFTQVWNPIEDVVEIKFAGSNNLIENPQFDYIDETATGYSPDGELRYQPLGWTIEGDASSFVVPKLVTTDNVTVPVVTYDQQGTGESQSGLTGTTVTMTGYVLRHTSTGAYDIYPVVGSNILTMYHDSDTGAGVSQRIKVDFRSPYWLSFYASYVKEASQTGTSGFTGNIHVGWKWYDLHGQVLEYPTGDIYTGITNVEISSDYSDSSSIWNRYGIAFGSTRDSTLGKQEQTELTSVNSMITNPIQIPSGAYYVELLLGCTGYSALSAVSFTEGYDIGYYTRNIKGTEATIEYDIGSGDLYRIDDLTITPIRNTNSNGFLYIGGLPARQFDEDAPEDTTTLTDWNWATGRLEHLPWARTSGKNKLTARGNFNIGIKGVVEDVTVSPKIAYPKDIEVIPRVPVALMRDGIGPSEQIPVYQGDAGPGVKGTDITIRVTDNNGNPYAFENVTVQIMDQLGQPAGYGYCGLLGVRELGIYSQYNTYVTTKTDSAGVVNIRWIPPASDNAQVEISDPLMQIKREVIGGVTGRYIGDLPFRVNPMSMGNPVITTALKPDGYSTYSENSVIEEFLSPFNTSVGQFGQYIYAYRLSQVPHRETVDVWINATGTMATASGTITEIRNAYDLSLDRSEFPEISDGEFYVDEPRKLLFVSYSTSSNDDNKTIRTLYSNRKIYLQGDDDGIVDNRRLYLSDSLYNSLLSDVSKINPMSLTYDMVIDMSITAHAPSGITSQYVDVASIYGDQEIDLHERNYVVSLIGKGQRRRIGL
jgi:hypothetical protein